jgi:outer membrane protein assembly factor BamA
MRNTLAAVAFLALGIVALAQDAPTQRKHRNTVREVVYQGAGQFDLRELDQITRLRPGMPLDPRANKTACEEIEGYLKERGYHFAAVSLLEGDDEKHERVVFDIDAGPQVRVRDVGFAGCSDWTSAAKLAEVIKTRQAFFRSWGELFRPDVLDNDAELLVRHFRANGFLDAQVEYELAWRSDFHYVDVTFRIQEGKRYRVAGWRIDRTGGLPRADLARLIKLKKGDFCVAADIRADERGLADWGGRQGKRLTVSSSIVPDPKHPGLVRVQYTVADVPVDYVGEVIIIGNTVTKDEVIRREVTLMPGEILDYTQLPIIERKLRDLGIFCDEPDEGDDATPLAIAGVPAELMRNLAGRNNQAQSGATVREYNRDTAIWGRPEQNGPQVMVVEREGKYRDIVVRVHETRTGSLRLGFGLDLLLNPTFSLVLEERNFDPERWPTNWAEFYDGRAFRGAGKKFRLELGPTTIPPSCLDWLSPLLP